MTRLLLDYPWTVSEGLGPDSAAYKVILDFLDLLARTGLDPVPFIDHAECSIFWDGLKERKGRGRFGPVIRFLNHCTQNTSGICLAHPTPEPKRLKDSWKRALHDELNDLTDWRKPQLIIPTLRHLDWEPVKNETAIYREPCNGQPASTHHCVLAVLERYESHPFALSDLDPWDVQCTAPLSTHPCYLPNPLIPDCDPLKNHFQRVPIAQLYKKLAEVHRRGWQVGDKHFFIPPADWQPEAVTQAAWREGRAFPRKLSPERQQMGYCDSAGRVWVWHKGRGNHKGEDHWDVQLGGTDYISVNYNGVPL